MRKILLVGQFTDRFREVNKYLSKDYEVRACVNKLEIFKGMFKLNKPEVVIILINEMNEDNEDILKEMQAEYAEIPVVCSGIKKEEIKLEKTDISKFVYVPKDFTQQDLIKMVECALDEKFWNERMKKVKEEEKKEDTKEEKNVEENEVQSMKEEAVSDRKYILLVDDSGVYLRMINALLEENYDVKMATSGLKALSMIREKRPDLILLDYEMPLCDGRETMIKIRQVEENKDIPIVFVTAVNEKEHIKAVLSLKPTGYLLKPIDRERLLKTVKEILH